MKLYVGGLSFDTTDDGLRTFFEQAGTVESASVITDRYSGRSRGFGFVEMSSNAATPGGHVGSASWRCRATLRAGRRSRN
jgi:hypothetical protein